MRFLVIIPFLLLATACSIPPATAAPVSPPAAVAAAPAAAPAAVAIVSSPAVLDAMKSLRKLDAATEVGITRADYGPLLVTAKADVNAALDELPDGPQRTAISATMDAYADASTAWEAKLKGPTMDSDSEPALTWRTKYQVPGYRDSTTYSPGHIDVDAAMQLMWSYASKHLAVASALLRG